jgi:hypothetical protein
MSKMRFHQKLHFRCCGNIRNLNFISSHRTTTAYAAVGFISHPTTIQNETTKKLLTAFFTVLRNGLMGERLNSSAFSRVAMLSQHDIARKTKKEYYMSEMFWL